jgi:hypothetical protein
VPFNSEGARGEYALGTPSASNFSAGAHATGSRAEFVFNTVRPDLREGRASGRVG